MKKSEKAKTNSKGKAPKISQPAPDGEFVEDSADPSELFSISEVARELGFEEEAFIDLLIEDGVLYREGEGMPLLPYAEWVEKGYLVVVPEDTTEYPKNGCGLIAEERSKHAQLGWTDAHDDLHLDGELRDAAIAYATSPDGVVDGPPTIWPFAPNEFHYEDSEVANLIKAGALIGAEIDRHWRLFQKACNEVTVREFGFTCFDDMNAYDLLREDWVGVDPEEFIKQHFRQDIDRLELVHAQKEDEDGGE